MTVRLIEKLKSKNSTHPTDLGSVTDERPCAPSFQFESKATATRVYSCVYLAPFGADAVGSQGSYLLLYQDERKVKAILFLSLLCLLITGCGSKDSGIAETGSNQPAGERSYQQVRREVRQAVAKNDLKGAARLVNAAMIQFPGDAGLLADAAAIHVRLGDRELATDLLLQACSVTEFRDDEVMNTSMSALKDWGKLYRLADLFNNASEANPKQWSWKWKQTELLYGLELRDQALEVSFDLVRSRQFRLILLERMAWDRERQLDTKPLAEAYEQNPAEPRVLLGVLRKQLEEAKLDEAEMTEQQIAAKYPRHPLLAYWSGQRILRDQTLNDRERYDASVKWFRDRLPEPEQREGLALLAMAQMSVLVGEQDLASQLFETAAMQLPNHAACWAEYARRASMAEPGTQRSNAIIRRAEALNALDQLLDQWRARQRRDLGTGLQLAKAFDALGRRWEAEAWCAAMLAEFRKTPEFESADYQAIATLRQGIVAKIKPDTRVVELGTTFETVTDANAMIGEEANEGLQQLLASLGNDLPVAVSRSGQRRKTKGPAPTFRHVSSECNLSFHGRTADDLGARGIPLFQTLGCGGGTIDFDRDGLDDLVFADAGGVPSQGNHRSNRIFRNLDGVFEDVTNSAGYQDSDFGQGIAIGDINGDGLDDIFNTNFGQNRLLINQGDGSFREVAFEGNDSSWSTSAAIADLNSDSHADIVYLNYCEGSKLTSQLCADDKQIITMPADGSEPPHHACSPMQYAGSRNAWIPGNPSFQLEVEDLQVDSGLQEDSEGRSLGLSIFRDLPRIQPDLPVQLLIANDMSANELWLTQSTGGRPEQQPASLLGLANGIGGQPEGSMGVASLDINEDGRVDFLVTNFEDEYNSLYLSGEIGYSTPPTSSEVAAFKSVGFGVVSEDFAESGQYSWVVTNGHVDDFADLREGSRLLQPMQMFRFSASGKSSIVIPTENGTERYFSSDHCGRALWTADIDNDMRQDLVVTHQDKPVALLRNETPLARGRSFAEVELVGVRSDRNAVGTWITHKGPSVPASWSLQIDSYLSTNTRRVRLSWDSDSPMKRLEVHWPSGSRQTIDTAQWNALSPVSCIIVEGQAAFILDDNTD